MIDRVIAVIMAAGEGTRMKSRIPKVLHKVCGRCIIDYVVGAAREISSYPPVVVVGHLAEEVKKHLGDRVRYAYQNNRLGTGHAVMMARSYLEEVDGYAVVLAGDIPLITGKSLREVVKYCQEECCDAVAISAFLENPEGYGRIVRNARGEFERIVEHKDATSEEKRIKEVNASIYCFKTGVLLKTLKQLNNDNAQKEYYLTDVLKIIKTEGGKVGVYTLHNSEEILGVNTRQQLAFVERIMRRRINRFHMENGVTLFDPDSTYISADVVIGQDTVIYPGNVIEGHSVIEEDCVLYPNNRIVDSKIRKGAIIQASVILNSEIGQETTVGPYAYIRPGSVIGNHVRIGDFVEIKNSEIGDGSKVSHLTYIGDGTVGKNVNVGCGVVFVNYDGERKYRTTIGDNAFIGCNVNLIAPVEVEKDTYIAAGSTITEKVPQGSLAIARARQVNKEGWVLRKRAKKDEKTSK